MDNNFLNVIPVLPSSDIKRDIKWYKEKAGFETVFSDSMYALLQRGPIGLHLQWHADTEDDPLLGGSVIRIFVKDIKPIFEEFLARGTVGRQKFLPKTTWGTAEFGFYDPNNNAIFIVEDLE